MANVHILPPEVLCAILLYLSINGSHRGNRSGALSAWIAPATHTCRRWRQVALGLAELWADNVCCLTSDAATDCFIQRAQSMPLAFRAGYEFSPLGLTEHQITLAHTYLSQTRVFMQALDGYLPSTLIEAFGASMLSCLTVLRIHRWDTTTDDLFLDADDLFALDAPALHELYLDGVFLEVKAPQLLTLSVTNYDQDNQTNLSRLSRSVIWNSLRGMPLLQKLILENVLADEDDEAIGAADRVELPHLKRLELVDESEDFGLTYGIRAPASLATFIEDTYCNPSFTFPVVFAAMQDQLRAPSNDTLIVCEEKDELDDFPRLHVVLSTSGPAPADSGYDGNPGFRLDALVDLNNDDDNSDDGDDDNSDDDDNSPSAIEILEMLLPHVDVQNITFLDLGDIGTFEYKEVTVDDLRKVLVHFPNVTTIQLNVERHIYALLESDLDAYAASDEEDEEMATEGRALILPELQHLVVVGLYEYNPAGSWPGQISSLWRAILRVLKARERMGVPLRYLTLADRERIRDTDASLAALENVYISRAKRFVDTVINSRGSGEGWDAGRIWEHIIEL